jgi:hypothetical protein
MKYCKRILAGVVFLLAPAVLLLSLAGGVGIWIVKEPATTRATRLFGRIEAALDDADKGIEHVKTSLARASDRLISARKEQRRQPRQNNAARRFLARTVQQTVAPELGSAHETIHTVAEAAVVVNSMLEDLGNFPFLSVSGLDVAPLREINSGLTVVESSAWELTRLLGDPPPKPDSDDVQLSGVERILTRMQRLVAEQEPRLAQVRQRTEQLKARALSWILPASVLVSLACFWIAFSQVILLRHAWSRWRHSAHNDKGPG